MLNAQLKKNGSVSVIAIISVIAHAFLALYGEGDLEFADTLSFALSSVRLPSMLEATGKNVVPVEFDTDVVLNSSHVLELMGGLDFHAQVGDVLVFRKKDGAWKEIGRYLTEGI